VSNRREYLTPTRALAILAGIAAFGFVVAIVTLTLIAQGLVSFVRG
jgi:hypothetical protein